MSQRSSVLAAVERLERRILLAADFGDAPDLGAGTGAGDYETLAASGGPSHTIDSTQSTLFLGTGVDGDSGTLQSVRADADDYDGGPPNDENGVFDVSDLSITAGGAATIRLRATNNTGSSATLSGWIDFNRDGVFDNATERAQATVANPRTNGIVELTFDLVPFEAAGTTYARFRLSTDSAAENPTGAASDGEVEDHVVHITSPARPTPAFSIELDDTDVPADGRFFFGSAVTSIGDLDGDGVDDLAVGASAQNYGDGGVHILLMNETNTVKSSTLVSAGDAGFMSNARFGSSVAALGDLDGDGVTDLAAGARQADAVSILFMNADGTLKSQNRIDTNDLPFIASDDEFGVSLAALGDLDGDGVMDLAVGAKYDGGNFRGAVHVLFLNADGSVKTSNSIDSNAVALESFSYFGTSIDSLGDFDGDGLTDIAVGSTGTRTQRDFSQPETGAVHLLMLNANGSVKSTRLIDGIDVPSLQDNDSFGSAVASLGDLDGDGVVDLAVGAYGDDAGGYNGGAVHFLLLNEDGSVKSSSEINASNFPSAPGDRLGSSLARLGDINGDGAPDLAVGARDDDGGGPTAGAVHLVMFDPGGTADYGDAPDTGTGTGARNYETLAENDGPGHVVDEAIFLGTGVDVDDGTLQNRTADADDLDGGPPSDENGVFDRSDLEITAGTTPTVRLRVTNNTGREATLTGWIDYDGDGVFDNATERAMVTVPDLTTNAIVELIFPTVPEDFAATTYARFRLSTDDAAENPTGLARDGEVEDYVVRITRPAVGLPASMVELDKSDVPGLTTQSRFGSSVTSIGDLDGDGVDDLAVGAYYGSTGDTGSVHILFMTSTNTVKSSVEIDGTQVSGLSANDRFGSAVASLGDLDGDGVTDIAVGAEVTDIDGSVDAGAVHILFLNPNGTVKSSRRIDADELPALAETQDFGRSLASLGDLDGDGVTDLAVGAGGFDDGAVHVLLLNSDGSVKSENSFDSNSLEVPVLFDLGISIASMGDIDGDGITDIALGGFDDNAEGFVLVAMLNSNGSLKSSRQIETTDVTTTTFGFSVSSLGDLDGDGITDLAVGQPGNLDSDTDLFLLLLDANGGVKSSTAIDFPLEQFFGRSIALLGDVNGDGAPDLAVGAPRDDAGPGSVNTGAVHIVHLGLAPEFESITRRTPTSTPTNADSLVFRATFSKNVDNVDGADFVVTGGTTATVTNVSLVAAGVYDLTVSGGDLASFTGVVGLDLADDQDIVDFASIPLPAAEPDTDETYTLDSTAPVLQSFVLQSPSGSPTNADVLVFRATFSEDVQNVDAADFVVGGGSTATVTAVAQVAANVYDLTVSGGDLATFDGTVGLDVRVGQNIADGVGNPLATAEPSADQTFVLDNTAPVVQSFARRTPAGSLTNSDTLSFRVTFSEDVRNVDAADFIVTGTTATITSVGIITPRVYDLAISGGNLSDLNGTVGLDLDTSRDVVDLTGNLLSGLEPATDETYELDNTAPTLLSIARVTPNGSTTNADSLTFRATFSEAVQSISTGDFRVNGGTTANVTAIVQVAANVFDLTVSGGDLADSNGTVGLDLRIGQNVVDFADNPLPTAEPATDEVYELDNSAPTLVSFSRLAPATARTNADTLVFRATFSEAVQNVDAADFEVVGTTAAVTAVSRVSADVYDITVSGGNLPALNGTVGLDLDADQDIVDLAGNTLPVLAPPADETYELDNTAPVLQSFVRQSPSDSPTNADTLVFRATFSEAVQNVDAADFVVGGGTTATISSVAVVAANVYDVTVSGGNLANLDGDVELNVAAGQDITDLAGNSASSSEPAIDESYELDNTDPILQSFARQNPVGPKTSADTLVFRATFSEAVANLVADDFAVTGTTATVTSVTMVSPGIYDLVVAGGDLADFEGTVGLDLAESRDIRDLAGNLLTGGEPSTDETYELEQALVIDNGDPNYVEFGSGWASSGLSGVDGSGTRYTTTPGAGASWRPVALEAGWYTVEFYNVQHPSNTTNARLTIVHGLATVSRSVDQRNAASGYGTVGTFYFDGNADEAITLQLVGTGILRADAVRIRRTTPPPEVLIDNGQTGYAESGGGWADSGLPGNDGSGTRYSGSSTAKVTWSPTIPAAGWYTLELFNVQHDSNTTNARLTVVHAGAIETRVIDQRNTAGGFTTLGRFYFDGGNGQSIVLENLGTGILRADAVRLTATPPPGPGTIDNGQTGYSETAGTWGDSGLAGSNGSGTRFSSSTNAEVTWRPNTNLAAGWYTLDLYNVQHPSNTTSARITIKHAGNTITRTINPQSTPNGYLALGTFYLDGSGAEAVTIENLAAGALRADALRIRATPPPAPVTIDNGEAGHSEFGFWGDSGLTGQNGSSTRFTSQTGAGTTYRPANLVAGFYVVEVYNVKHPSNTTNARVTIKHAGVTETRTLDQQNSPNGYVSFGTFFFDGSGSEAITLQNLGGFLRADAVRLRSTQPPQAQTQQAAPGAIADSNAPTLTQGDLDSLIDDALAAWANVGVDPSAFDDVRFAIGDLAGNTLGTYANGLVTIDTNAAGHGWFVDTTPEDDTEFAGPGFNGNDSPAGFDLFTVLKHELGHHLGLPDETDNDGSLLETELNVGERRHITDAEVDLLADRSLVDEVLYG